MAKSTDTINLSEQDYRRKKFKTAPGGTYFATITRKTKITPGRSGNILKVHAKITKGPHKSISFFDNIAPHVGWKVAQLLHALGVKKMSLTLQALLKMILDQDLRVVLREKKFDGKTRNEVVQWLPLKGKASDDDEDADDDEDEDEDEDEEQDEQDDDSDDEDEDDADEDEDEDDADDEDEEDDDDDDDEEDADDDASDDEDDDDSVDAGDDDEDEADDIDDEEEETPPARGRRAPAKKAAAKKAPAKKAAAKKTTRAKKK